MKDDEKQNKKVDDSKLDVAKTTMKVDIGTSTKINPLHTTMISNESILGLDRNLHLHSVTGLEVLKTTHDFAGGTYGAGATMINPLINAGAHQIITGRTGLENIKLAGTQPSGVLGARVSLGSPATMDFNPSFTSLRPAINLNESNLTREDIEKLIDKKTAKKDDGIKKEQVIEIVNEITDSRNKQEIENVSIINIKGLDFITKELLAGKERDWRCAKCGKPLEIFKGEEGIEKIKQYLINFRNNISKKCANGHDNWFELKEDGINWVVKVIYEKEFRLKS